MSHPIAHYALAGLCVIVGAATHIWGPEGSPIPLTLIIAGTGVLAKSTIEQASKASKAQEEAARERKRADHWQEQTQQVLQKKPTSEGS